MPRFLVRVGYDWVQPRVRDVEVEAADENAASQTALTMSATDVDFWTEAIDTDGEAGSTEVIEIERRESD